MINNAAKCTIAAIFGQDENVKYVIPKYQRQYTWKKENWAELLDDIQESDGYHFIGSIIAIKDDTIQALQTQKLEIVDGQQRLTTISLLFCALYKILKNKTESSPLNGEFELEVMNLKYRLLQRRNTLDVKLELSEENSNYSDYKSILSDELKILPELDTKVKNRGNRIIYKAYKYFVQRLEEMDTVDLVDLLTKISEVLLVKIEVSSHSDAFMLFESLNNRGVPLSAIDLVKNKMLAALSESDDDVDTAFHQWKGIIKNLPEYPIQERFLRQLYNAFKYDSQVRVEGIPKATRSNLIRIYENLIDRDPSYLLKELINKSKIYSSLLHANTNPNDEHYGLSNELRDLINVKAAPSYVLLLYLFSLEKDEGFYKEVLRFIVKYFTRRNVTDFPNTRNLDQIFIDLINELETDRNGISSEKIIEFLTHTDRFSSLSEFKSKLEGNMYDTNVEMTRFILSKIEEEQSTTRETNRNFWERDKTNKLVWTIEHIFPEGKNIPTKWIDMIAGGDEIKAKVIQEEFVHKLGNLTLTGYNPNLSNFPFIKKRDRADKTGKAIGYRNGLFLNEDLKDTGNWIQDDIEHRTEKLVSLAIDLFGVEGERLI